MESTLGSCVGREKKGVRKCISLIIIPTVQFHFNTIVGVIFTNNTQYKPCSHLNPINSGMMNSDKSHGKNDECS